MKKVAVRSKGSAVGTYQNTITTPRKYSSNQRLATTGNAIVRVCLLARVHKIPLLRKPRRTSRIVTTSRDAGVSLEMPVSGPTSWRS